MNDRTDNLITALAINLAPVRRLASPERRLVMWLAISLPVSLALGSVVEQQTLGIATTQLAASRLSDGRMVLELAAILVTALSAGYAALASTQPGRPSIIWVLPVLPLLTWMALVGEGCWQLWLQIGDQLSFAPHWTCYPSVVATGAMPVIAIVIMLRRGSVLSPVPTIALATLAASALGAVGLRLFHPPDATVMLMLWQLVATVSFFALSALVAAIMRPRLAAA